MVIACQKENDQMKRCLTSYYQDEKFKERCTNEYLAERSEFRRTGITKKKAATIRELRREIQLEKERNKQSGIL